VFLKKVRKEGRSRSYLASLRGMLYQIFHKAAANDIVRKNPVEYADKMRFNEPTKKKAAFTAEEVKLLMEKLPMDRTGMSIRLMLGTGMRSQELFALEPRHIEADGSIIHIQQAINMVKGTSIVGQPKSVTSYRDIPVPPNLRPFAMELRNTELTYIWEAGKPGQPCNPSHFRTQFKKAIKEIDGVRELTPHSCRHTYVSQMQALGVDIQTIQSIVGHADIDMTTHYLDVQAPVKQSAVEKFSAAFPVTEEN
jgi:integrase